MIRKWAGVDAYFDRFCVARAHPPGAAAGPGSDDVYQLRIFVEQGHAIVGGDACRQLCGLDQLEQQISNVNDFPPK